MSYINENDEIIMRTKDEIYRILTAFLKSGINIDKEVFPVMPWRKLYLDESIQGNSLTVES